jgi:hypothetical protein
MTTTIVSRFHSLPGTKKFELDHDLNKVMLKVEDQTFLGDTFEETLTLAEQHFAPKAAPTKIWVQKWTEYERGWGQRPDGYTLHKEFSDIDKFLNRIRREELLTYKGETPDEYSAPTGKPYETLITDPEILKKIEESDRFGIWGGGSNDYPKSITKGADQSGWVQIK